MKNYQIYDVQLDEILARKVDQDYIIGYAYGIMVDRAEAVNDDLGQEFAEITKNGVEGVSFDKAVEILNDWEYEVFELTLVGNDIEQYFK
jgi:hypothetical protein